MTENFVNGRVDVLGVSETHIRGTCVSDGREGMWEGVPRVVVWTGIDEKYRGRSEEGCAIVMSERVWNGLTDNGWKGSRIVWVKGIVGFEKYAWVCIYAPVNVKSKKGLREREAFWEEVNACLKSFEKEKKLIMMGDMNAVGKWGIPGKNENGECLVDVCAERGMFLVNTFFQHKNIHRYTWRRRKDYD